MSKVYFTKEITEKSLEKIYEALSSEKSLTGKIGVKISTGEQGGNNYLHPELISSLVKKLGDIIVECNTAYGGSRDQNSDHRKTIKNHGFNDIATVDIMDEDGEFEIPTRQKSKHLKSDIVGDHLKNYDGLLMLSHFKGHAMGGFGGALKNMSIGVASHNGKLLIHSAGESTDQQYVWLHLPAQDDFLESMAEADCAVSDYLNGNILYINITNRLSVDCDCDSSPAEPEMNDLGIFASVDPVALDQACYDAVKTSDDPGKTALVERMDSRHAIHTVEWAAELGLGECNYEIINL
ncbi:MAG: DUF362 domain-containing protein, partial [Candidatus Saccharibacteria bacterium]|nr:DUF362 domain-containing protein [Candidatus Saccharibacteria bacterium]